MCNKQLLIPILKIRILLFVTRKNLFHGSCFIWIKSFNNKLEVFERKMCVYIWMYRNILSIQWLTYLSIKLFLIDFNRMICNWEPIACSVVFFKYLGFKRLYIYIYDIYMMDDTHHNNKWPHNVTVSKKPITLHCIFTIFWLRATVFVISNTNISEFFYVWYHSTWALFQKANSRQRVFTSGF